MDPYLPKGLWRLKGSFPQTTRTASTKSKHPLRYCNCCIQIHVRRCTPPSRHKRRLAPMLLPIKFLSPSWKKLWCLQLRTSHCYQRPESLAPLSAKIPLPSSGLYRSQEPHLLPPSTTPQPPASPLACWSSRLQPQIYPCPQNLPHQPRHLVPATWPLPRHNRW